MTKICSKTVRADFNDASVVMHYTRAAHQLGLWASERLLIERWLPDRAAPLLEVGCGAGRATLGLWDLGYQCLTAVDFAGELLEQARRLAALRAADAIRFVQADATRLNECNASSYQPPVAMANTAPAGFGGALFLFNGLMQIPGRESRRQALRAIRAVCRPGAIFIFTTHDRDDEPRDRPYWAAEADRWARGGQDPRLVEFGDRYFHNDHGGHTFMHLPTQAEVREDLAATGWILQFDAMRRTLAPESRAVREFSDECRFWVAGRSDPNVPLDFDCRCGERSDEATEAAGRQPDIQLDRHGALEQGGGTGSHDPAEGAVFLARRMPAPARSQP